MIDPGAAGIHGMLRARFPEVAGAPDLPGRAARPAHAAPAGRPGRDPRTDRGRPAGAAPVLAALRLALLHAILPSSRLATQPGRAAALRIAGGHVRPSTAAQWRERNPWLAFEDAFRGVRGFIQRLDGGALGPVQARLGEDLRSLGRGPRRPSSD